VRYRGLRTVAFDDCNSLKVGGLPPTAYDTRQWWANSSSSHAQSWRDADWHIDYVDFRRQRVRYTSGRVGGSYRDRGHRPAREAAALVAETDAAELDVRVHMSWQRAGQVALDTRATWCFLPCRARRASIGSPRRVHPGSNSVYVGESDDLRNRSNHYRRPGPTQPTNQGIHAELQAHLRSGGQVTVAVVTTATIDARESPALSRLAARRRGCSLSTLPWRRHTSKGTRW
jgi:hypothetical protein